MQITNTNTIQINGNCLCVFIVHTNNVKTMQNLYKYLIDIGRKLNHRHKKQIVWKHGPS